MKEAVKTRICISSHYILFTDFSFVFHSTQKCSNIVLYHRRGGGNWECKFGKRKGNVWWGEWKKLIDVRHVLVSGFYKATVKRPLKDIKN